MLTITGASSCVGKNLALMELRYVVAQVVNRYDVALASGQNKQSFLDGKRDTFKLSLGQLNIIFFQRE
jgi:cytochrome P450